ncbi:uncharacterized protein MELLADRAFT_91800 [Melampsora larici-populina 98AG31]|uniref:Uncharacterized protein n=1 Tax=Melampsora larici-populina (strain 98AG31 / pathotype 3-4-7) TaxID=747676 RepID=F4S0C9_MELLP|nr:uncharacterized protein MELLADRAFT_91800 [Melampsora larici-populina 98AG31]EGG01940.1 hypothetical protein MELLADRAFT_91800 [Melampsora larici-populina 98AG31]
MNQHQANNLLAHHSGSFNPTGGRLENSSSSFTPGLRHPENNIVQIGSETYYTVGNIQQNGYDMTNNVQQSQWPPQQSFPATGLPRLPPTQTCEVRSTGPMSGSILGSAVNSGSNLIPNSSAQIWDIGTPGLSSLSNGAVSSTNKKVITRVDQCPDFWNLPVSHLYEWQRMVDIQDHSVQDYFNQALKKAEDDLDEPDFDGSDSAKFKFNSTCPSQLDLLFMRCLAELSPFGTPGKKLKVFKQCATLLKMDSGTVEDDKELRELIHTVEHEEENGLALKLASKEERETLKNRYMLAEDYRDRAARGEVRKRSETPSETDDDGRLISRKPKKARNSAASHANAVMEELSAFSGEMSKMNEAALTAQAEQNNKINLLYERELTIAAAEARSLEAHRKAELALEQKKFELASEQSKTTNLTLEALDAKVDSKMTSINDALAAIMTQLSSRVQ